MAGGVGQGELDGDQMDKRQITPDLPTYEIGRRFLRVIDGVANAKYRTMVKDIYEHIRNPKDPADWKEPEEWIPKRLKGPSHDLALHLWRKSGRQVNPRHTFGPFNLCKIHQLFSVQNGRLMITDGGAKFIDGDEEVVARIDDYDGMLLVLAEVAAKGPGRRRDFEERYAEFCRASTTYAADSSISSSLIYRLNNLVDRRLISKTGHSYQITHMGLEYLGRHGDIGGGETANPAIVRLASASNATARKQLADFLSSMNPYKFEHLIKLLLEKMNFEKVEVTSPANDKGVDVVAEIELGISRVREVIQVKRIKGNVARPILDLLRGSLHRFDAVRGTIITTGQFSKGANAAAFEKGAAPITLIDGEKLLDLLIEHDIGIRRREIRVLQFDADSLRAFSSEVELEAPSIEESGNE